VVRFQDADAAGIIFFGNIPVYFHDAYFEWLMNAGFDLPAMMRAASFMAPVQQQRCDYLSPLRFGDEVEVEVVGAALEGSAFAVGFRLICGSRCAAVGQQRHVVVDRKTLKRVPPPEDFAAFLQAAPLR